MAVTKTYTALAGSKIPVGNCSTVLENHMQCWRAGDYLVEEIDDAAIPDPILRNSGMSLGKTTRTTSYQLCRRHAIEDQNAYEAAKLIAPASPFVATPQPEVLPRQSVKPSTFPIK